MSLKSKLIPIIASIGAATTVAPILSSCSGGLNMETHNMLNETYYHHVLPCLPKTLYDDAQLNLITDSYMKDASLFSSILKDDILYTYSKIIPKTKTLETFAYEFTKYYLYVQDFDFVKDETTKQWSVNFSIIIDMAGKIKTGETSYVKYNDKDIEEFNLQYTIHFDNAFAFKATNTVTEVEKEKQFTIALPKAANDENGMVKSIALGILKAPGEQAKEELINVNEEINLAALPETLSQDKSSLVFYREFFRNIAVSDEVLPILSNYFYYVTYVLPQ